MTYRITPSLICILILAASCSSVKQTSVYRTGHASSTANNVVNKNPKFLDNISITPDAQTAPERVELRQNVKRTQGQNYYPHSSGVEKATPLQFKYALLLNTDVEEISNISLFNFIDEWYGTRYCMGGTTKTCIDCSAFVQTFFSAVYGLNIPRTAKDQFAAANRVATSKLQQGDLLFFNTRGGISHVGIYLQNNKFVHASTTGGVMISDMFEPYYVKHFVSAGHIDARFETARHK